jgi:predicted amidohydrolase
MSTLRVAAFQRQPRYCDLPGILNSLLADLAWCDREGVDLALFPECYLQGYLLDRPAVEAVALALDGDPAFQGVLDRLALVRTAFIVGLIERDRHLVFNTAAFIRHGAVLGRYRKTLLHRKEQAFDAGHDYPIFEIANWKFGINICYDANFPEAAATIGRQGARLLCYPLNNMLPTDVAERWRRKGLDNLRHRAAETGCWVISSDVVGEHQDMLCYGCSCIVNPDGEIVARVDESGEGVATFDIDNRT